MAGSKMKRDIIIQRRVYGSGPQSIWNRENTKHQKRIGDREAEQGGRR